jgi:hypothetical protein
MKLIDDYSELKMLTWSSHEAGHAGYSITADSGYHSQLGSTPQILDNANPDSIPEHPLSRYLPTYEGKTRAPAWPRVSARKHESIFSGAQFDSFPEFRPRVLNQNTARTHHKDIVCPFKHNDKAPVCGGAFDDVDKFKNHVGLAHSSSPSITWMPGHAVNNTIRLGNALGCSICERRLTNMDEYDDHLEACLVNIFLKCKLRSSRGETRKMANATEAFSVATTSPSGEEFSAPYEKVGPTVETHSGQTEIHSDTTDSTKLEKVDGNPGSPHNSVLSNSISSGELSFIEDSGRHDETLMAYVELMSMPDFRVVYDKLIFDILEAFDEWRKHGREPSRVPSQSTTGSAAPQSSNSNSLSSTTSSCTSNSLQKSGSAKRSQEHDDEGGNGHSKRKRASVLDKSPLAKQLLACPYAKHDRARYSEMNRDEKNYRGCASKYLRNIARLKQHLHRVHCRPAHYCPRCYIEFPTEEGLQIHSRGTLCDVVDECPFEEKMTASQKLAVKRREMRKDPEQAWYDIFGILFPGADLPPTPYTDGPHDGAEMGNFLDFFERDAPSRIVASAIPQIFGTNCTREVQELVETVLESCLSELVQRYRQRAQQDADSEPVG